ncbi:MAG: uncharacterized protein KVP18_003710 [Porospora cf. gigantea A]|uniref:uncharacterized protein n=1 Tax=Porospora cf. gigantea A TaxID=2853593 RepID=UPI00355ABF92|nr:MAG: hypothetical protein KVP18_003710 [Porospora cf. gigantea A]
MRVFVLVHLSFLAAAFVGDLTLYHFNDQHARWARSDPTTNSLCFKGDTNYDKCAGGIPKKAKLFQSSSNKPYLVIDAGDEFQGTPLFNGPDEEMFGLSGKVLQRLWKHQSVDAFVLGNHEFDNGVSALKEFLKAIQNVAVDGRVGLTTEILCANCEFTKGGCDFSDVKLRKSHVYCFDAANDRVQCTSEAVLKIGAIGLSLETESMRQVAMMHPDCELGDWKEAALREIEAMDPEVDGIVLITHIGVDGDRVLAAAIEKKKAANDVNAKKVFAIIGGHSHTMMCDNPAHYGVSCQDRDGVQITYPTFHGLFTGSDVTGKVPIYQDHWAGRSVGQVVVNFAENQDPRVILVDGTVSGDTDLLDLDETAEVDPDALNKLQEEMAFIQTLYQDDRTVAQTPLTGGKPDCRQLPPCDMGVIGTDAMLGYSETMYADAPAGTPRAVMSFNTGGCVRSPVEEGDVSWGKLNEVYPFLNFLQSGVISGQNLIDNVKWGIYGLHPLIQFSGLRVTLPDPSFALPLESLKCYASRHDVNYVRMENASTQYSPLKKKTSPALRFLSGRIDFPNIINRPSCANLTYNVNDITVHHNRCLTEHLRHSRPLDGSQPPYPFPSEVFACSCWENIRPEGEYAIVTHSFITGGGDGYCFEVKDDWYSMPSQPLDFDSILQWAAKGSWAAQPTNYHCVDCGVEPSPGSAIRPAIFIVAWLFVFFL